MFWGDQKIEVSKMYLNQWHEHMQNHPKPDMRAFPRLKKVNFVETFFAPSLCLSVRLGGAA
jgi:hypothetical protein